VVPLPALFWLSSYINSHHLGVVPMSALFWLSSYVTSHHLGVAPLPALFWLSSYVTSHLLAVTPQSGAKDQFYCTVYYITLNTNCEAQGVSKI
jgi:hypothetical protein